MSQGRIDRQIDSPAATIQHMRVDHGHFHVLVPQQFLNRADVVAVLQRMPDKRMAERVPGHPPLQPSRADGLPHRSLDTDS